MHDTDSARRLGEFEQLLMYAVLRLGEDAHGVTIRQEIESRTGDSPSPGAIYTGMDRLEARGYVESWLGDSTPERGGRRRKHYRLLPAGATALERSSQALRRMADGLAPELRRVRTDDRA